MTKSEQVERYRRELERAVAANDDDGLRRAYRELLEHGESRQDVVSEILRVGTRTHHDGRQREIPDPVEPEGGGADVSKPTLLERAAERVSQRAADRVQLPTHFAPSVIREVTEQVSANNDGPVDARSSALEDPTRVAPKTVTHAIFTIARRTAASVAVYLFLHGSAGIPSAPPAPISEHSAVNPVSEQARVVASAPIPGAVPDPQAARIGLAGKQIETKAPETLATVSAAPETRSPGILPQPTAAVPAPEIQAARAPDHVGAAPMKEPASAARSGTDTVKEAPAQASSRSGPNPDMMPIVIPAEERGQAVLPPAAPTSGAVSTPPTNNPPIKATPDPALLARGDASFAVGDLAAARLFYERAANAGDAQAALRLGQTYDPAFLAQIKGSRVRPDASAAVRWYLQADNLGAADAAMMLRAIAKDLGISTPARDQASKP